MGAGERRRKGGEGGRKGGEVERGEWNEGKKK